VLGWYVAIKIVRGANARRSDLKRELDGVERKIAGIVKDYSPALKERLAAHEKRKAEVPRCSPGQPTGRVQQRRRQGRGVRDPPHVYRQDRALAGCGRAQRPAELRGDLALILSLCSGGSTNKNSPARVLRRASCVAGCGGAQLPLPNYYALFSIGQNYKDATHHCRWPLRKPLWPASAALRYRNRLRLAARQAEPVLDEPAEIKLDVGHESPVAGADNEGLGRLIGQDRVRRSTYANNFSKIEP
jgi:hypothetical protein